MLEEIFDELVLANIPLREICPNEDSSFDIIFTRGLTEAEVILAEKICSKFINTTYTYFYDE